MSRQSLPLFAAWRQTLRAGYSWKTLRGDLSAGLTVGIIAIPLAMALAIAVGCVAQPASTAADPKTSADRATVVNRINLPLVLAGRAIKGLAMRPEG